MLRLALIVAAAFGLAACGQQNASLPTASHTDTSAQIQDVVQAGTSVPDSPPSIQELIIPEGWEQVEGDGSMAYPATMAPNSDIAQLPPLILRRRG